MKKLFIFFIFSVIWNITQAQDASIDSLKNLSSQLFNKGKFDEVMKIYLQLLDSASIKKDPCLFCDIYYQMSTVYSATENKEAYISNISKSEMSCIDCNKMKKIARLNRMKGLAKYYQQQFDSAIAYFQLSADQFFAEKDSVRGMVSYNQIGNIYEELNKPQEANKIYTKAYDFIKLKGDKFQVAQAGLKLVNNYNSLKDGQKALSLTNEMEGLIRMIDDKQMLAFIMEYKAIALKLLNKNDEAFNTYQQYMRFYKDTLISDERNAEIENLKTKYETEKKETVIALQNAKIQNQKRKLWGILGLLLLSGVIGYFLLGLNKKLKKSNEDKEFLIKEIHHRVKNNLQVLSSLLHLQSRYIKDDVALDAMREGQNRVDAMGLIHQKLYTGNNLSTINMDEYIPQLVDSLSESFGITIDRLNLDCQIEKLNLDVDKAIPLGLIVNELITNSFKYAFPNDKSGRLTIKFQQESNGEIVLFVKDGGEGEAVMTNAGTSFGTSLIDMLVKKLKGKMEISKSQGHATTIRFNQNLLNNSINE